MLFKNYYYITFIHSFLFARNGSTRRKRKRKKKATWFKTICLYFNSYSLYSSAVSVVGFCQLIPASTSLKYLADSRAAAIGVLQALFSYQLHCTTTAPTSVCILVALRVFAAKCSCGRAANSSD